MRITFRGVRGSVPWATSESIGVGCNTPCVEVRDERTGSTLLFDAGTGIVGPLVDARAAPASAARIVLSHYHWDHVQGLPFLAPLSAAGARVEIWGPQFDGISPASVRGIFQSPFYPVPLEQMPGTASLHVIDAPELEIGGFRIATQRLNHPGGSVAYRVRGAAGDLVYATDHEFGSAAHDEALAAFVRGARAVVLDAHFTPDELATRVGWGHGSWAQCAQLAASQGAGQLWLFHHMPGRSDADVARIEESAAAVFPQTRAAREGVSFEV
jgi:phosphoribosyl 1,2-cyclic phosphodiesterase